MTFVSTFLKNVNSFIAIYGEEETKIPKEIEDIVSNIIIFSCVWSIGAAIEETSRKKFN